MKILFCEHNSICEPGIIRAFRAMGHEIVFSINFVPVISTACHICNISYLCWIVDSPVIQLYSDTLFLHNNYVFIFDRTLYKKLLVPYIQRNVSTTGLNSVCQSICRGIFGELWRRSKKYTDIIFWRKCFPGK